MQDDNTTKSTDFLPDKPSAAPADSPTPPADTVATPAAADTVPAPPPAPDEQASSAHVLDLKNGNDSAPDASPKPEEPKSDSDKPHAPTLDVKPTDPAAPAGAKGVAPKTGWNWGAFLLSWIWGIGNGVWISLLAFVPFIGVFVPFYLGFKGYELAWNAKKWESPEQFIAVQKKWTKFGIIFAVIGIVVGLIGGILMAMAISSGGVSTSASFSTN